MEELKQRILLDGRAKATIKHINEDNSLELE